jgi:hypothetical protein
MSAARPEPSQTRLPACVAQIRLGQHLVSAADVRAHPERYARQPAAARAEVGFGQCLCKDDAAPRLVIRRRAERFHLAVWPQQGHHHATTCLWYRADPTLSGSADYENHGAIEHETDGTTLRLAAALTTRSDQAQPPSQRATTRRVATDPTPSRHALSLLALLHFLRTGQLRGALGLSPGTEPSRS